MLGTTYRLMGARMSDAQTALAAANTNEQPGVRQLGRPLLAGLVLLPFVFVWFLLGKGYSPAARILGFGWTIIFTSALQLLPNAPPAEPEQSQAIKAVTAKPEPVRAGYTDGIRVSKRDFEGRGLVWPLTVEEAHIGCDKGILLWIAIDGEKHGLNGTSVDWGYPSFRPFWRDDAEYPTSGSGPKARIQDLFDAAKATCSTSG